MKKFILSTLQPVDDAPEVFDILPLGLVHTNKGDFTVDAESYRLLKQQMDSRRLDIVVDYEHQTLSGAEAPAAGWIKELILTDHSIAARTEWTENAAQRIRNREYRYCSPVVFAGGSANRACLLHSVALTNTPAIDGQFPIINKFEMEEETNMEFLKQLAALLKLPDTATEEDVTTALKALTEAPPPAEPVVCKTVAGLLDVDEKADTATVSAKIMALKNPANFVSAADYLVLKAKLDAHESTDLVEKALADGKITPAQKDWAKAYVLSDKAGFEKFVSLAPAVVPMGQTELPPPGKKGAADTDNLLICKNLGLSADDLKQYGGNE